MKHLIAVATCLLFLSGCGLFGIPDISGCGIFAIGCGPPPLDTDEVLLAIAKDTCLLTDSSEAVFDGEVLLLEGLRDEDTSESDASAMAMTFCVDLCATLGSCEASCDDCVADVVEAVYR